jgi:hypothetical protein
LKVIVQNIKEAFAPASGTHDKDDLVVAELKTVPVGSQVGGPMLWLQKDSGPQWLEVNLQGTFKKNRADAASDCNGQLQDKNGEAGYSINGSYAIPAGVQTVFWTFRFKTAKIEYTSDSNFRIMCKSPGMVSAWYSVKLPDIKTAVAQ